MEETKVLHKKKVLTPKLRFNGFEDEWKNTNLSDIADFLKGKGISKTDIVEDGELECIRYGELYTTYNELIVNVVSKTNLPAKDLILSEYNDVIIPASGETQLDIATASCVLKAGVALSGDLNIIRSPMNGIFLSFYLNNKRKHDIAKLAQGSSVVHLYSSQLQKLKLNIPSLPEQQKIANFLSAVDEKIQLLNRKKQLLEQYKKGVMQQLFSGKLRFKDENGKAYPKWEKRKLGEICEKIQDGNYGASYPKSEEFVVTGIPFLTSKALSNDGTIIREKIDFITIEKHNELKKAHLKLNDVLFTNRGANVGAIGLVDISISNGNIGPQLTLLRVKPSMVYYNFLFHAMTTNSLKKQIKSQDSGSAMNFFGIGETAKFKLNIPHVEEQKKIADFLSAIDVKIENLSKQINQTQNFKKGLLQQMFV